MNYTLKRILFSNLTEYLVLFLTLLFFELAFENTFLKNFNHNLVDLFKLIFVGGLVIGFNYLSHNLYNHGIKSDGETRTDEDTVFMHRIKNSNTNNNIEKLHEIYEMIIIPILQVLAVIFTSPKIYSFCQEHLNSDMIKLDTKKMHVLIKIIPIFFLSLLKVQIFQNIGYTNLDTPIGEKDYLFPSANAFSFIVMIVIYYLVNKDLTKNRGDVLNKESVLFHSNLSLKRIVKDMLKKNSGNPNSEIKDEIDATLNKIYEELQLIKDEVAEEVVIYGNIISKLIPLSYKIEYSHIKKPIFDKISKFRKFLDYKDGLTPEDVKIIQDDLSILEGKIKEDKLFEHFKTKSGLKKYLEQLQADGVSDFLQIKLKEILGIENQNDMMRETLQISNRIVNHELLKLKTEYETDLQKIKDKITQEVYEAELQVEVQQEVQPTPDKPLELPQCNKDEDCKDQRWCNLGKCKDRVGIGENCNQILAPEYVDKCEEGLTCVRNEEDTRLGKSGKCLRKRSDPLIHPPSAPATSNSEFVVTPGIQLNPTKQVETNPQKQANCEPPDCGGCSNPVTTGFCERKANNVTLNQAAASEPTDEPTTQQNLTGFGEILSDKIKTRRTNIRGCDEYTDQIECNLIDTCIFEDEKCKDNDNDNDNDEWNN